MGITSLVLIVFAPQTVSLIAPGFDAAERDLYVDLFRLMCVTPVIFAASIVLGEILVAERRFLSYGLAPLFYNGGIVAGTLLLGERIGIFARGGRGDRGRPAPPRDPAHRHLAGRRSGRSPDAPPAGPRACASSWS